MADGRGNPVSNNGGAEKLCPVCGAPDNALIFIKSEKDGDWYECENCGEAVKVA